MTTPVDVLIIGAGASGAAVAWSLAETKMHILCLEQGDWMKPSEYPSAGRDWEARQLNDFHYSPNRRARDTDYPINEDSSPIKIANFNGVGGGTVLYAGHFPRFHPSDFRVRTLDGVADDWPIDYATLAPFYDENDRMMGVSGLAGDPAYPPHEPMMAPLPLGRSGATLARGMNKLGWHWWPSDSAIASEDYEGRAKCINLAHCTSGCAQGAKASTDITYWPAAIRAGVELRTRCRVREITRNEHGMASGVVYYDADGVEQFQPAEVVILACNAIGTPRVCCSTSQRSRQFLRPRRQEPDVPPVRTDRRVFRRDAGRLSRPGQLHLEPGILRDGPLARVRTRLHVRILARPGSGDGCGARHADWAPPLGRGSPPRLSQAVLPPHRHGRDLRGSAGRAQHGDARSGAEGHQRHSRAEDQLHAEREQPPHAGSRCRAGQRDPACRGRARRRGRRRRLPTAVGT